MLHQQNRQNDRGPDEATTEGLGPWNRVASGPESSSTESSDLAMGDAVSRVRSSEARWVWWVWRVAFCLSHAPITAGAGGRWPATSASDSADRLFRHRGPSPFTPKLYPPCHFTSKREATAPRPPTEEAEHY
ncbi:hypothetical protein THAOC_19176 [Thalassiosira oceanica]|uniref:Uncharacterized protein n=1 Tax=Thalassiosira oceanica TaxID=159749 RepID=K0SQ08_THAOC|nr:hypothetical protein THAOC_19176 [Thalassiosira oceanica]|eukprot:EJK60467.1 hypothetical protein THAOC_19176 [Thalassiosira oceanica]